MVNGGITVVYVNPQKPQKDSNSFYYKFQWFS